MSRILDRQWFRDQGMMMQHRDEMRSNLTFQEVADRAFVVGKIEALEKISKQISEAREKDLQPYRDSLGEEQAATDRECRGLAHGYASAWLILHGEIKTLQDLLTKT